MVLPSSASSARNLNRSYPIHGGKHPVLGTGVGGGKRFSRSGPGGHGLGRSRGVARRRHR